MSPPETLHRARQSALGLWSVLLAVLVLGPALGPGYVLSYDMVWVPDLALGADALGLGSGLPRAVPSDAVVAVLDQVVPAMLLQKVVLLASLVAGGMGAARLTDRSSWAAQLVALTLYQYNPFVAERLLIGHWPVLVGYGALPWIALGARRWRTTGTFPVGLLLLVPVASLSAGAGLVTMVVLIALAGTLSLRRLVQLAVLVLAANAPWLVSGLLHAADAASDPTGARVFALHGEGSVPGPLAALSLGGIWNAEVVPVSRTGPAGWIWLVLVVVLLGIGLRRWIEHAGPRDVAGLATCWWLGWTLAVLTWLAPDQLAWVFAHVPGSGVLRDGARMLALCAPLLVAVAGHGAARVVGGVPRAARPATTVALLLVPLALMPDAAFGLSGRLVPTQFPDDYGQAREVLAEEGRAGALGDVLLLPLSSYRQPAWNHGHKVLDPVGRFLGRDFIAGDDLYVSGRRVAGEDPQARAAAAALDLETPARRSRALAALGVADVVTESGAGPVPPVAGEVVHAGPQLVVQSIRDPVALAAPVSWQVAMSVAWMLFGGLFFLGAAAILRRASRVFRLDT